MKLLLMFLVNILSFNIIAMEYDPESDIEESSSDSTSSHATTVIVHGTLKKQNPNDSQQNKVLKCFNCGRKLLFQNQLDLKIAENNILCSLCEKRSKRRLTRSK